MNKRLFFTICLIIALLPFFSAALFAEEIELVNRPANTSGLTGLLVTTSPFTLETGTVETGIAAFDENSSKPNYILTEYSAYIVMGIAQHMELALKGSYFHEETSLKKRGAGDTEITYKWNFLRQPQDSSVPAVALIIAGIAPTGDTTKALNRVQHWGARVGFATGTEITWEDHVLGMYADAYVAFQDLSDDQIRDLYHIVNAGMLFPISKHQNLQLLLEYTIVSGKERENIDGLDYTAVTPGLRLVSERFNLSMGIQFLSKELELHDDSSRVIGMLSMKF
ncbi:MAG TPA: hypothetical protein DCO77_08230 [Nitrospiraceae bacterium]|nr:hypothetical protein [Nitrospiraceae bacterium]